VDRVGGSQAKFLDFWDLGQVTVGQRHNESERAPASPVPGYGRLVSPEVVMSRSRNYVIAALLAGLLSLANTIVALTVMAQGAHHINHSSNQPPYAVFVIEVIIGLIGLVAAYGVYRTQRWGVVLTLVLMVVNVLVSLPGIPSGPTTFDKVGSAAGLVAAAAVIWLLLRRDRRVEQTAQRPA
jgi:peptidoglycan/LPS O-acetylase OafA/YrhL